MNEVATGGPAYGSGAVHPRPAGARQSGARGRLRHRRPRGPAVRARPAAAVGANRRTVPRTSAWPTCAGRCASAAATWSIRAGDPVVEAVRVARTVGATASGSPPTSAATPATGERRLARACAGERHRAEAVRRGHGRAGRARCARPAATTTRSSRRTGGPGRRAAGGTSSGAAAGSCCRRCPGTCRPVLDPGPERRRRTASGGGETAGRGAGWRAWLPHAGSGYDDGHDDLAGDGDLAAEPVPALRLSVPVGAGATSTACRSRVRAPAVLARLLPPGAGRVSRACARKAYRAGAVEELARRADALAGVAGRADRGARSSTPGCGSCSPRAGCTTGPG